MNSKRFTLILAFSLLLAACASYTSQAPMAVSGGLDLSAWDFERNGLVRLDGEWEFYWGQLLTPEALTAPDAPRPDGVYPFPTSWSTLSLNNGRLPNDGYVTLRLRVKLPPGAAEYGLFAPSFNTAYLVWVNGEPVAQSGRVATSASQAQSAGFGQMAHFTPPAGMLDIIVQVSSFEGVPGGPIGRFILGPAAAVAAWDYQQIAIDLFVVSTCAVIGIYYLFLYLLRRKEIAFLWFSLFCLFIALRTTLVGREIIHLLLQVPYSISLQLIFLFSQATAVIFAMFVSALYPQESWPRLSRVIFGLGLVWVVVILATPPALYFGPFSPLYNGFTVLTILYSVVVGARAIRRQRPGARLLLFSTLPLAAGVIIEGLGYMRVIPLYSVAGFGVVGTIIGQTFLLLRNFTLAFAAVEALSERLDRTNKAYYRFVPRELLRLMGREDIVTVELGDQSQRLMTVLFLDVRGFTSLSEKMSPAENFRFINSLLSSLSPIIREQRGFIDKYMGDGIMALFPEQPADALNAAIVMQRGLADFNAERVRRGTPPIRIGIGLHTGNLMLGTVGEPERMDGTVIADAVNTASRLESLTKRYLVTIIASGQVLEGVADRERYATRALGKVRAKGKQEAVVLYEVFDGDPPETVQLKRATRADFEAGVQLYQAGKFAEAQACFERGLQIQPNDQTAQGYRERAAQLAATGAPPDWDGVESLTEK